MRWLAAIGRELLGMFVDDGRDSVAILGWLAAMWLLSRQNLPSPLVPALLFAGLACILVESAARRARKGRAR